MRVRLKKDIYVGGNLIIQENKEVIVKVYCGKCFYQGHDRKIIIHRKDFEIVND